MWLDSRGHPVDVPSPKVLPKAGRRAIPYQYTDADITALMAVCGQVFSPFRAATMRTLTGLLAAFLALLVLLTGVGPLRIVLLLVRTTVLVVVVLHLRSPFDERPLYGRKGLTNPTPTCS